MYYAIKDALEKAIDLNRVITEIDFLDELFKSYATDKSLVFVWELLKPTFEWAKDWAIIESDLEKFKERVVAEMYCVLSDML